MSSFKTFSLVSLILVGCTTVTPSRNLAADPQQQRSVEHAARRCALFIENLVDERPEPERRGGDQKEFNLVFPILPVLWYHASSGYTLHDPELIGGAQTLAQLREGLGVAVANSKVCSVVAERERATHLLRAAVEHLYGMNRERAQLFLIWGGVVMTSQDYHPAGHVALRFELIEQKTNRALARWRMSEGALMHKGQAGVSIKEDDRGVVAAVDGEANRLAQIVEALSNVYLRLPDLLDVYLSASAPNHETFSRETFMVARLLPDYEHVEFGIVDFETGRVVESGVAVRSWPVFSEADRWVVAPYQPNLLDREEYRRLIQHLEARYDVGWEENVAVASFKGIRSN